jgi:peptidoglycan hydrolase CwlO-like protein
MKKIALSIFLILLVIIGFVGYENKTVLAETANQLLYQSPCATPKEFRIGSIDPRFGISKNEFIQDADEAASAWKNSQGMILLEYNPNASMPISMIYDQRQALNSQINNLNSQVTQQKNSLKPEISDYQEKVATFQQQSNSLNSQIQYWNSKGGAPSDVYNKLVSQQQSLQQQAAQLQQMANQLNQSTDQYNQQVGQLNQKVDSYNTVLSLTPEEGLYTRNGTNESIDIYITNSQRELIHTLAHEMGHSLGLGHNSNPNSIMYPYTNLVITPSVNDKEALEQACQKRSIFEIGGEDIILILGTLHQDLNNLITKYQ